MIAKRIDRFLMNFHFDMWLDFDCPLIARAIDRLGFIIRAFGHYAESGEWDFGRNYGQ